MPKNWANVQQLRREGVPLVRTYKRLTERWHDTPLLPGGPLIIVGDVLSEARRPG